LIKDHELVDIFIGVDVGKSDHHAVAIDRRGSKVLDLALAEDETNLRSIIKAVAGKGRVLVAVDQPSTGSRGLFTQVHPGSGRIRSVAFTTKGPLTGLPTGTAPLAVRQPRAQRFRADPGASTPVPGRQHRQTGSRAVGPRSCALHGHGLRAGTAWAESLSFSQETAASKPGRVQRASAEESGSMRWSSGFTPKA
jgi:hypothetical protein